MEINTTVTLWNILNILTVLGAFYIFHRDQKRDHKEELNRIDAKVDRIDTKVDRIDAKFDRFMDESNKRWYDLLSKFHDHDKAIDRLLEKRR